MKKNSLLLAAAFLLLVLMSVGCYTVLKHPQVEPAHDAQAQVLEEEEFGFEAPPNRVTFGTDCQSCHNSSVGAYHAMTVPAPVAEPSPRWSYYYDTPWWFPYYASPGGGSNTGSEAEKKRPFDRRRNSVPEEPSASAGNAAAPAPAHSAGSLAKPATGNSDSSSTTETKRDDTNKRSERRSSDTEKKETSRRDRKP